MFHIIFYKNGRKKMVGDYYNKYIKTIRGWAQQRKEEVVPFMEYVIKNLQALDIKHINFCEIGLCKGNNFMFIGNILQQYFDSVFGIGIDLPNVKRWGGTNQNAAAWIKKINPHFPYHIIWDSSHKEEVFCATKTLAPTLHLLFIDGDHSFDGCKSDFETYKSIVVPGGIIGFHDIIFCKNEPHIEVWKVWNEIKNQYEYKEYAGINKMGIGAIKV